MWPNTTQYDLIKPRSHPKTRKYSYIRAFLPPPPISTNPYSKNDSLSIDAFKLAIEVHPNLRLFVAGNGPQQKELMMRASPIWSKISFTGFIDRKELYKLFSVADIGVLTSLHEEFGFVAVEMMMHRLPMIVNDSTGLAELIDDGVNGLKFKIIQGETNRKVSVRCIADKIIRLIDDAVLMQRLGRNARRKYLKKYESSRFRRGVDAVYNAECIGKTSKSNFAHSR